MAAVAGKRAEGARAAEERAASAATGAMEVATVAGARSRREGRGPREEAGKEAPTAAVATAVVVRAAEVTSREAEVAVLAAVSDS
jgi:hypothetical protein